MNLPRHYWWLLFAITGGILGLSSPLLFPHAEATITSWQIRQTGKVPSNPAIVVIELEHNGPFSCGVNSWNRPGLADIITALRGAKASVVAPLVPLKGPASPQCGGMAGDARLIESIHQDNIVIPADSAPFFIQSAKAVGHTALRSDVKGVLQDVPPTTRDAGKLLRPWGEVVAQIYKRKISNDTRAYTNYLNPPGRLRWSDQTYRKFSDIQIGAILQEHHISTLKNLVQEKVVLLVPKDDTRFMIPTPFGEEMPEPYAHIEVLQNSLSGHALRPVSVVFLVIVVCMLALGSSVIMAVNTPPMGLMAVIIMGILYEVLMWAMLTSAGVVLPILAPMVTVCCATGLTGAWKLWSQQSHAQSVITKMEQHIAWLKQEMIVKEQRMANLAEQLQPPIQLIGSSSSRLPNVQESFEGVRKHWGEAQAEVEKSRRRLQELESQLALLRRQQSPHVPEIASNPDAEMHNRQQQCQSNGIVTCDPQILNLFADLKKAAGTLSPILLTGETGTGKEVFAKAVHTFSSHPGGPLVAVNVAAIRPELFESELFGHARGAYTGAVGAKGFVEAATNGTLFLDEIGEIPLPIQAKLLRLIEDGTYYRVGEARSRTANIRIVAATNRDLWKETQQGRFRADLYYRLSAFSFCLPPLRERIPKDRRLLAQFFLQDIANHLGRKEMRLSQGAMEAVQAASWPGNIRELKHTLTQAATLTEGWLITEETLKIKSRALPKNLSDQPDDRTVNQSIVRSTGHSLDCDDHTILTMLREHRFDMQATAKSLRWDRSTVTQRLKGLGFQALVRHQGNVDAAAQELAGEPSMVTRVRAKLRDYYRNLIPAHQQSATIEDAMNDCRRRMKNLPDRYFTAVETLLRWSLKAEPRPTHYTSWADK